MKKMIKKTTFLTLVSISATQLFPSSSRAELLWDNWYVVSANGVHESYFNERAEITGDQAKIRVNYWIKEGTKVRSENFGGTAKNTPELQPLLFNYRTREAGVEKVIDGTILNHGKIFSVKVKRGERQSKPILAEMLPKLTLVSFFPLWIHKNYKKISSVQPKDFIAIIEDQVDREVPVGKGSVFEAMPDDFAKQTKTRKLRILFRDIVAFWYVGPKGDAVRITFPTLNKEVNKTTREEAEKSL